MTSRHQNRSHSPLLFRRDFSARRIVQLELPEFVIFAIERNVNGANADADDTEAVTLNDYVESELVRLITIRDVAEIESVTPGFAAAVQDWLRQVTT